MAWTTPRTWAVGEAITADLLNTHLRDNLSELKDPPSASYALDESSDYTTTSTSFVDVDATNLSFTINTTGGDVMAHFHGTVDGLGAYSYYFDIDVDGTRIGLDDGIYETQHSSAAANGLSFTRLITGLAAGSHTFKLQWKVEGGTGKLYAGAGTSTHNAHGQFWVREVS